MYKFLVSVIFLFSLKSYALQIRFAENHDVVRGFISDILTNTVSVENDRISNYVVLKGDPIVTADNTTGILYININDYQLPTVYLSVSTEKGHHYTLYLSKTNKLVEPILIRQKVKLKLEENNSDQMNSFETQLIDAMQQNLSLEGFTISNMNARRVERVKSKYEIVLMRQYQGQTLDGYIYQIHSMSNSVQRFDEKYFAIPKVVAIAMSEKVLPPNGTIYLYRVMNHG